MTNECVNASVVALDNVEVYTIGRELFESARDVSMPFIGKILEVYGERKWSRQDSDPRRMPG